MLVSLILFSNLSFGSDPILPSSLLEQIKSDPLIYKEKGMLYGAYSIQACLYANSKLVVLNNYCFPVKKYPAKSYMILSNDLGWVQYYQEELSTHQQNIIRHRAFSEDLNQKFNIDPKTISIAEINQFYEYFSKNPPRFCYIRSSENPNEGTEADCYLDDINKYLAWKETGLFLVDNVDEWNQFIDEIEKNIPPINL